MRESVARVHLPTLGGAELPDDVCMDMMDLK